MGCGGGVDIMAPIIIQGRSRWSRNEAESQLIFLRKREGHVHCHNPLLSALPGPEVEFPNKFALRVAQFVHMHESKWRA